MKSYDHKKIEARWQKEWEKKKLYKTSDVARGKKNHYVLVEFPYPSGNLHVGHWYAFSIPDILVRTLRMQGKNVLYPIGFDAFGLPAENAAIKNKLNPRKWTYGNIAHMREQMRSMGTTFDWSREVITCDPTYYKWTQWQFLQFFKKGLAYRKNTPVNWCPSCKTVLANEQVVDGRCERCKTEVVQKEMLQWNLKITDYADRLHDDLEKLDWPKEIKESQKNWIGRSEGAIISFQITAGSLQEKMEVFTTRADTLFGATYLVLAPEHPMMSELLLHVSNKEETVTYIHAANKKTELERQESKEKTGVELKGVKAINPATGEEIPVWIADYVLAGYGTGAIMAVPAHDERDFEFAKKFKLPIREVVEPIFTRSDGADAVQSGTFQDRPTIFAILRRSDGKILGQTFKPTQTQGFISGGIEDGETPEEAAVRELAEETGYTDVSLVRKIGGIIHSKYYSPLRKTNVFAHYTTLLFELKSDTRIEMSEEEKALHTMAWMTKEEMASYINREDFRYVWKLVEKEAPYAGEGILANSGDFSGISSADARIAIAKKFGRLQKTYKMRDWIVSRQRYWGVPIPIIHCPTCGEVAVPEKDLPVTLPEIKDYLPDGRGKSPLAKAKKWVQVKCPKCKGKAERETDTLDTFVDSSWYYLRYCDPKNKKKFSDAKKQASWMPIDLYSGGAEHTTMHLLYSRFWHKALYDLRLVKDTEPYTRRMNRSLILGPDGQKMSKSRGNVIDPDQVVARLGADTVRMYLAFIGPYNEVSNYPWNPDGVVGVRRFLERVWRLQSKIKKQGAKELDVLLHKTIKKAGEDIATLKFNTAISQMMIFLNGAEKAEAVGEKQWKAFLTLLAPFAPHITEELWRESGNKKSIHLEKWPSYDAKFLVEDTVSIAVQVNGKTRGETRVASSAGKEEVERAAREAVSERLVGKEVVRTIVVPGRLVNFVVRE